MKNEFLKDAFIVAEDANQKLICETKGITYTPDLMKHKYGESQRKPLEDQFLTYLDFFKSLYKDYEIFTLGSSLVFGERFVTYNTICEFSIETEKDFANLVSALKHSDLAIRKKFYPMWKWCMAARRKNDIVFMVGWLDFAYFLQHRNDFLDVKHNYYMSSFMNDKTLIKSKDYKVLKDGEIVEFDENKLSKSDSEVFLNFMKISYERVALEKLT